MAYDEIHDSKVLSRLFTLMFSSASFNAMLANSLIVRPISQQSNYEYSYTLTLILFFCFSEWPTVFLTVVEQHCVGLRIYGWTPTIGTLQRTVLFNHTGSLQSYKTQPFFVASEEFMAKQTKNSHPAFNCAEMRLSNSLSRMFMETSETRKIL